jgi:hypothetical protein
MSTIATTQHSYQIYAGDFQFRTPQNQGPVQNAAFDKGIITVALRSLYGDAAAPSYVVQLIKHAHDSIENKNDFSGIVGMGDYFDMGCEQERDMLSIAIEHMLQEDPNLRFTLMVPGNHDGGQFMGTLWSTKNFGNVVGIFYPKLIEDVQTGICGEADAIEERHESVRDLHGVFTDRLSLNDVTTHVKNGNRRLFRREDGEKIRFRKDPEKAFDQLWHKTKGDERWECVIHYDANLFGQHGEEDHSHEPNPDKLNPFKKLKEFAHVRGDVKQWIQLQAHKQVEFQTSTGSTVPIYNIALDTMDFTSYSDFSGTIKGHISKLQISVIENFMDEQLKENPNAKFKLAMHYPIDKLVCSSQGAFKKLLERDEIILVTDAHVHERGFEANLGDRYKLKRLTPLPHLTIPSTADLTHDVVVEDMAFSEVDHNAQIDFTFHYEALDETEIPGATPLVFEALNYFETEVAVIKERKLGKMPSSIYINENDAIQTYDAQLKRVANGHANRGMQIREILNIVLRLKGRASDKFVAEGSIPQMKVDFEYFLLYLEIVAGLLKDEDAQKYEKLFKKIAELKSQYGYWKEDYEYRKKQNLSHSKLALFNNLYTLADLDEIYNFLNDEVPVGGQTKAFILIAGLRASNEETRFHGYTPPPIPDAITAQTQFTVH